MESSTMASSSRKYKLGNRPLVTLIVGPQKTKFLVYEDILCEISNVFAAAFSSNLKEGTDKVMILPGDSEKVVDFLVQWVTLKACGLDGEQLSVLQIEEVATVLDIYIFSEKMQIDGPKAFVLGWLNGVGYTESDTDELHELFEAQNIRYVYEHTSPGSGLRRLLVWLWIHRLSPGAIGSYDSMTLLEFSADFKQMS